MFIDPNEIRQTVGYVRAQMLLPTDGGQEQCTGAERMPAPAPCSCFLFWLVTFAEGIAAEEVFSQVGDCVVQCLARIAWFETEFTRGF